MKKRSKKGFTLAELLIVVAIIGVLVAIMFPVFGAQLNKARAAAELANVRSAYSEAVANALLGGANTNLTDPAVAAVGEVTLNKADLTKALQYPDTEITVTKPDGADGTIKVEYKTYSGTFAVDADVKLGDITSGTAFKKI